MGKWQDGTAFAPNSTLHAPQDSWPQPYCGPFRLKSFRKTYNSGVSGAAVTVCFSPLTVRTIELIPKNVLIAKIVSIKDFEAALISFDVKNANEILTSLKNQEYTNLLYLPPDHSGCEYVAALDEITWITVEELNSLREDIVSNRIAILDYFGYYLFIFKLSFHLCRLPEETDR
jgi:hypothetical protein